MIRILQIMDNIAVSSGVSSVVMNIYRNINREMIQFDFLVSNQAERSYEEEIKSYGGEIYYTGNPLSPKTLISTCIKNKRFFKENSENYVAAHLHSPTITDMTIKYANKYGIRNIIKDGGWNNYTYGMKLNDTYIPCNKNKFMLLYAKDYANRPSCYKCVSKEKKQSDITLGDFWGIEKLDPQMTDNKGTSIVITRTEKGQKLFEKFKKDMIWKEVTYEEGVRKNPSEYKSSLKPEKRMDFFNDMELLKFDELYEKYCPKTKLKNRIFDKIKRILNRIGGVL